MAGIQVENDMNSFLPNDDANTDFAAPAAEVEDVEKARKAIFNAAVTTIVRSSSGIMDYFSLKDEVRSETHHKVFSDIYAITIFVSFSFGMALFLLSFVLSRDPISVDGVKKLVWVARVLLNIAIFLSGVVAMEDPVATVR